MMASYVSVGSGVEMTVGAGIWAKQALFILMALEIAQLSSPVTSLLFVWTVNLELQHGLSVSSIFKILEGVTGFTVWTNIHLRFDTCYTCPTESLPTAGDLHGITGNEFTD